MRIILRNKTKIKYFSPTIKPAPITKLRIPIASAWHSLFTAFGQARHVKNGICRGADQIEKRGDNWEALFNSISNRLKNWGERLICILFGAGNWGCDLEVAPNKAALIGGGT